MVIKYFMGPGWIYMFVSELEENIMRICQLFEFTSQGIEGMQGKCSDCRGNTII